MTTTRKEDKLRPYRIDYFNVNEMNAPDFALVRSEVVRAVTAEEAIYGLVGKPETWSTDTRPLVVIRAYRFYRKLGAHKQDVFKSVEDLFPANKAVEVMDVIESYRKMTATNDLGNTPAAQAQMDAVAAQADAAQTGHVTRFSDSSLYDEVCTKCGATDASGKLDQPCPATSEADVLLPAPQPPTSGPDSPATIAVVADLQGMIAHDEHEQAMDTFVPTAVPAGKTFPDPTNVPITQHVPVTVSFTLAPVPPPVRCGGCGATHLPVDSDNHLCGYCAEIVPDRAVGPAGRPPEPPNVHDDGAQNFALAVAVILALVAAGVFFAMHHH